MIQRALAPVPADRFASALEFARALEASARSGLTTVTAAAAATRPERRVPSGALLLVLGLLVGAGALFAWRRQGDRVPAGAASGPIGVAVLPFDAEGDTANAYLADGITDEIRSKLSELQALQIIARASSKQYRHATKRPEEIGRELGVQYLLTGTVHSEQRPGGPRRVRVRPELIQVSEGRSAVTKWEQSFDTTLADVFDVQTAVASRVADNSWASCSLRRPRRRSPTGPHRTSRPTTRTCERKPSLATILRRSGERSRGTNRRSPWIRASEKPGHGCRG